MSAIFIAGRHCSKEMREAYKRCEEFLDLEVKQQDPILMQKEQLMDMVSKTTPDRVQEILEQWVSAIPKSESSI